MEDLLNLLIVFLIRVVLKPTLLKHHKADLEQYPLAPNSTAKSSTQQPLNSMTVFKAKYLFNFVLCQYSILFINYLRKLCQVLVE